MKAFLSALAVTALFIATASADWVVEQKLESPQVTSATTTKVKGDKLRVDIAESPAGPMSSIVDTKSGESIQLMHGQKMAMKTSGAALKQAMDAAKQKAGIKEGASNEPKPTGQSEKVGEIDCDIYTWTDGTNSSKLWVAKKHPQAAGLKAFEQQMRSGFFSGMQMGPDTSKLPGPAIKTESTVQGTKITSTIVSFKEEKIDDKEFEVPADYKSLALPTGN